MHRNGVTKHKEAADHGSVSVYTQSASSNDKSTQTFTPEHGIVNRFCYEPQKFSKTKDSSALNT